MLGDARGENGAEEEVASTSMAGLQTPGQQGQPEAVSDGADTGGAAAATAVIQPKLDGKASLAQGQGKDAVDLEAGEEHVGKHFVFHPFPNEPRLPVDVTFRDLKLSAFESRRDGKIETVMTGLTKQLFVFSRAKKQEKVILNSLNGTLRAGTSTLLLGPPLCGKSSLMKALAGRLSKNLKSAKLSGEVLYNGVEQQQTEPTKMCAFVEQIDNHFPLLTVEDTFAFAKECGGGGAPFRGKKHKQGATPEEAEKALSTQQRDMIETLGLDGAAETVIGGLFIRGVSGGERKRVTVGEMLFARQPVLLLDEISTGLDSSTTMSIVETINKASRTMKTTVLTSLLQPAPEVISLFDDLILMAEGNIIFHGPVGQVLGHFESLGYKTRPGRSLGEFLIDMTTSRRSRYYSRRSNGPRTVSGLAEAWLKSSLHQTGLVTIAESSAKVTTMPEFFTSGSGFVHDWWTDFRVVMGRQSKLFWADRMITMFLVGQTANIALVTGLLYLLIPVGPESLLDTEWLRNRVAVLFFSLLMYAMNGFALLPWVIMQRDVFFKQRDAGMYRSWSFVLASAVTQIWTAVLETTVGVVIIFWMTRLVDTGASDVASVFFQFIVLSFAFNLCINSMVKALGFLSPNMTYAFLINTLLISFNLLYAGFIIQKSEIPDWCIWIYWMSPVSWGFRSVFILIFNSDTFQESAGGQLTLGDIAFETFAVDKDNVWVWTGFAYMMAVFVIMLFVQVLILEKVRFGTSATTGAVQAQEEDDEAGEDADQASDLKNDLDSERQSSRLDSSRLATSDIGAAPVTNLLPFEPANFSFSNIDYTVKLKDKSDKQLLFGVSGMATAGRMTALVGASGAGKSTLLDVVAGRKTSGVITGDVLVDGHAIDNKSLQRLIGYCEQEDNHSPYLTVKEAVRFSATVRLPHNTTEEQIESFVDSILETLNLHEIADSKIGAKGKGGLSVGQFKRLTVAVEMAANPTVLFLDEPTSGLDATAAEVTMKAVKRLAHAGRTILCTIHQPSREVFALFDDILLLQKGGRVAYHGPVNKLVEYFSAIPENTLPVPEGDFNPSAYVLDVIGAGISTTNSTDGDAKSDSSATEPTGPSFDYAAHYVTTPACQAIEDAIALELEKSRTTEPRKAPPPVSGWVSVKAVTNRWLTTYWRAPDYNLVRAEVMCLIMLVLGITFWQNNEFDSFARVQSFTGAIFFGILMTGFLNIVTCLGLMFDERAVYYREKNTKVYGGLTYVLGSTLAELTYVFGAALAALAIFYFMLGMRSGAEYFFQTFALYYVYMLSMVFAGHLLSTTMPSAAIATLASSGMLTLVAQFCGFMISFENMPVYLEWVSYLSPARYLMSGILNVQLFCPCTVDIATATMANFTCNGGQACAQVCPSDAPGCAAVPFPSPTGNVYITAWALVEELFGYEERDWYIDMVCVLAFAVGFRLLDAVALHTVSYNKR